MRRGDNDDIRVGAGGVGVAPERSLWSVLKRTEPALSPRSVRGGQVDKEQPFSPAEVDAILSKASGEVQLQNHRLSDKQMGKICDLILLGSEGGGISKLSLTSVDIADAGVGRLCDAIARGGLIELSIVGCKFDQLSDHEWRLFCDSIAESKIKMLELEGNGLSNASEERLSYLHLSILKSDVTEIRRDGYLDQGIYKEIKLVDMLEGANVTTELFGIKEPVIINPDLERLNDELLLNIEANRRYQKIRGLVADNGLVTSYHNTNLDDTRKKIEDCIKNITITDEDLAFAFFKHQHSSDALLLAIQDVIKDRAKISIRFTDELSASGYLSLFQPDGEGGPIVEDGSKNMGASIYHHIAEKALETHHLVQKSAEVVDAFCLGLYESGELRNKIPANDSSSLPKTSFAMKIAMENPINRKNHLVGQYKEYINEYLASTCLPARGEHESIRNEDKAVVSMAYVFLLQNSPGVLDKLVGDYASKAYDDTLKSIPQQRKI